MIIGIERWIFRVSGVVNDGICTTRRHFSKILTFGDEIRQFSTNGFFEENLAGCARRCLVTPRAHSCDALWSEYSEQYAEPAWQTRSFKFQLHFEYLFIMMCLTLLRLYYIWSNDDNKYVFELILSFSYICIFCLCFKTIYMFFFIRYGLIIIYYWARTILSIESAGTFSNCTIEKWIRSTFGLWIDGLGF